MTRIALLSPGALGAPIGRALAAAGHEVLCEVSGRSDQTRQRAIEAGLLLAASLPEMISSCEVILSFVPPAQALPIAQQVSTIRAEGGARTSSSRPIYIDGNSISPLTAQDVLEALAPANVHAVKASVFGPSDTLTFDNIVVVSGEAAMDAAAFFEPFSRVKIAGPNFRAASAVKMSMASVTKTLPVLFLEAMNSAASSDQLELTIALFEELYPGISQFLRRTLPTYVNHARRRVDEMREIENWVDAMGGDAPITRSGRLALGSLHLDEIPAEHSRDFLSLTKAAVSRKASVQPE
ncbi:DUF1932 domain-containing protein [Methylocystis sp. MJC1]|jgi:3-hydroxyisobutyrate dehydrogenase-like beta-hydroxyacid dehydrogenase|uniref:NAD(P)-dependent oxidoreductase n=1 Tax=Methylocystis sp. MJC1 TaxID=2654282 RepID=UPI0013ED7781|nr:NAD(P)-dependent oxidoreductase [Methylocystis sp. MJC1]KAF2988863.1 2-hydroxy-3-oxopropionate reductase [Methylocystis sp. MJC1]UZX13785.1 DUF1932 domain-containing protein [Methylocystis sp. MJC1]